MCFPRTDCCICKHNFRPVLWRFSKFCSKTAAPGRSIWDTARLHVQPRTALVSALLEVLRAPVAVPRPVAALPAAVPAPAPAAPPAVVPVPPSPAPVVAAPLVPPSEVAAPSLGRGSRVRRRPRPDPYERQIQARAAALRRQALRREARVAAASAGSAADA